MSMVSPSIKELRIIYASLELQGRAEVEKQSTRKQIHHTSYVFGNPESQCPKVSRCQLAEKRRCCRRGSQRQAARPAACPSRQSEQARSCLKYQGKV
jgi:hypothetical protein